MRCHLVIQLPDEGFVALEGLRDILVGGSVSR
jgi:hypothetical protein